MRRERALASFLIALTVSGTWIGVAAGPADEEEPQEVTKESAVIRQGTDGTGGDGGSGGGFWANRRPCSCANSKCGCCTGTIFPLPAFIRQRACMNLTYIEDEFALKMAIVLNNRVLYNNKVSGRNPRPVCVSPPRIPLAQLCVKLHDVFLIERNMHACLNVEGLFNKQVLFGGTMGCMRVGANGFAVVRPEDGGGLPSVEPADPEEEPDDDYDYDQVDEEAENDQNQPAEDDQNQPAADDQNQPAEDDQNQPEADSPEDNNVDTAGEGSREAEKWKDVGASGAEKAEGEGTNGQGKEEKSEQAEEDKIVGVGTVEEV